MLKQKRTWNLIGCILGLVMLIVGLVFLNSPPEAYHTESAEYAAFGADYYTYQYDATKTVAENVAATANNLREIGTAQARYAGVFFMMAGALVLIQYGKSYFAESEAVQPEEPENVICESSFGDTEDADAQAAEE